MILFLDFDGVLHPEPCYEYKKLFCHRSLFESVINEHCDVQIVISSSWRHKRSLTELKELFSKDIRDRIIGVTPDWLDLPDLLSVIGQYPRQVEIEGWLRMSGKPWQDWVALDDRPYWFRPFLKNLVRCDPRTGLTENTLLLLREKLSG